MTSTPVDVSADLTVVVVTRDRVDQLLVTLDQLARLPERPPVIVVDNGSADATPAVVRAAFPSVVVVALDRNEGSAARNVGAATAATPLVAFSDDDSWWAPGSLASAAANMAGHPGIGLLTGRVLIGPDQRVDPVSAAMASSPLADDHPERPGVPVLGFLACAAVVRRSAFLEAGGFSRVLFFLGEEEMLAWDLASGGWDLRYVEGLTVHHHPQASGRDDPARQALQQRNDLLTTWMRRPLGPALRVTAQAAAKATHDATARRALARAIRAAPRALGQRRVVAPAVEAAVRRLKAPGATMTDASPR